MKILVTGAKKFIGKNLIEQLKYQNAVEILACDKDTEKTELEQYCQECDFIYHLEDLTGLNQFERQEEFRLTYELIQLLKKYSNRCPVILISSSQAILDTPHGRSKGKVEKLLEAYGKENEIKVFIYHLPNVFGKWCRPNHNNVVATYCYNISHNIPFQVDLRKTKINLVYIDDVVSELLRALVKGETILEGRFYCVKPVYKISLEEIVDLLKSFKQSRKTLLIPDLTNGSFSKKLYSTYLSYLPKDEFSYPLKMNVNDRGSFTEILRTQDRGQFSVNISKSGVEKGNHWHNTKNEKFLVVSGKALIQFRRPDSETVIEYHVTGEKLEVVDIPIGYTHNIINETDKELITFMWCNECFDQEKPDTYQLKVNKN